MPSGGQRWHAPVVKLGAQFVRLGGDGGEAADPLARRRAPSFPYPAMASVADPSAQSHRAACRPRFSSIRKNSPGGPDSAAAGTPRGRQAWCRLLGAPAGPARDIGAQHVVGCRDPVIPDRLAAWANSRTTAVSPPISLHNRRVQRWPPLGNIFGTSIEEVRFA